VWGREVDGVKLTFHLAGINNQNFLMRDEETGTYWQQITGVAVSGSMAGKKLKLIPADELTFALWRNEQPHGTVLKDVPAYAADYSPRDWDVKMRRARTVLSYARPGLAARDVMLGVSAFGATRAFPYEDVLKQKLVNDHVGTEPVVLVVGPDNVSVRVFRSRVPGASGTPEFYRTPDGAMLEDTTGSRWNFEGCAFEGKLKGTCLERVEAIKDYWFDWRHYNASTTVYGRQ